MIARSPLSTGACVRCSRCRGIVANLNEKPFCPSCFPGVRPNGDETLFAVVITTDAGTHQSRCRYGRLPLHEVRQRADAALAAGAVCVELECELFTEAELKMAIERFGMND